MDVDGAEEGVTLSAEAHSGLLEQIASVEGHLAAREEQMDRMQKQWDAEKKSFIALHDHFEQEKTIKKSRAYRELEARCETLQKSSPPSTSSSSSSSSSPSSSSASSKKDGGYDAFVQAQVKTVEEIVSGFKACVVAAATVPALHDKLKAKDALLSASNAKVEALTSKVAAQKDDIEQARSALQESDASKFSFVRCLSLLRSRQLGADAKEEEADATGTPEEQIQAAKTLNDALVEQLDEMETMYNEADEANATQQQQVAKLNSKNSDLFRQISRLKTQLKAPTDDQEKKGSKQLATQVADLVKELAARGEALEKAKREHSSLISSKKTLEADFRNAQRSEREQKSCGEELQKKWQKDLAELSKLRRVAKKAQEDADRYKADLDRVKARKGGSGTDDDLATIMKMFNDKVKCNVCKTREKDSLLSGCGHMFCRECLDDYQRNRKRHCPQCKKGFSKKDIISIFLST